MAEQDRDRYGDKMKEVERGKEEDYFARRERELIKKLREANAKESCPKCGATLQRDASGQSLCSKCERP